jgi:hypothetical protein
MAMTNEENQSAWASIQAANEIERRSHEHTYLCKECSAKVHQHIWVYEAGVLNKCSFCGKDADFTYCAKKKDIILK